MNPKYKFYEYFFPWKRLKRINKELDMEEQAGALEMLLEYWAKSQPKEGSKEESIENIINRLR